MLLEPEEYLQPSFESSRLTKPQLRSILSENGVIEIPPTTAKKEVLLELFERRIRSKAREILASRGRVRASGKGITLLDEDSQPSSPRNRSSSRSPTKTSEKRSKRSPSKKPRSKSRTRRTRTRKSSSSDSPPRSQTPEPIVEVTQPSTPAWSNPLQLLQNALPKYADSPVSVTIKLHSRLTDIAHQQHRGIRPRAIGFVSIVSTPYLIVWNSIRRTGKCIGGLVKKVGKNVMPAFLALVFAICLGIFLRWKFVVPFPYCSPGQARPFVPTATFDFDTLAKSIGEYCIPCPEHANCVDGKMTCSDGYLKANNWGFGAHCGIDRARLSRIDRVVASMGEYLGRHAGEVICGLKPGDKQIKEGELKLALASGFKEMPAADFSSTYRLALDEIRKNARHNIIIHEANGGRTLESAKPILRWKCQIYLYFARLYARYRNVLVGVIAACASIVYIWFYIKGIRAQKKQVERLVQMVLQLLAEQEALNRRDPTAPGTISVHQLRDALFLAAPQRHKATLWPRVCKAIGSNSNVRESVMNIKGEQHRVWEWIGADILTPFKRTVAASSEAVPRKRGTSPSRNVMYPSL